MSESFTLQGSAPPHKEGRSIGSMVVLTVVILGVGFLVWRSLQNRAGAGGDEFSSAHAAAEERKAAFQEILPGARLPAPFVLHGNAAQGGRRVVWMVRDFDDAQALFLRAGTVPDREELEALLRRLGGAFLPTRQLVDEPGVEIEKRPPFEEEFREHSGWSVAVQPYTAWTVHWPAALADLKEGDAGRESESANPVIHLPVEDGIEYPISLPRQQEGVWLTVVDLGAVVEDELLLAYLVPGEERPPLSDLRSFLEALAAR